MKETTETAKKAYNTLLELLARFPNGPKIKFTDLPPDLFHGQEMGAYSPAEDAIFLPPLSDFETLPEFCRVLCHEFIHSTGAAKRLNRTGVNVPVFACMPSDMWQIAKEELIAETGSSILAMHLGFFPESRMQHFEYMSFMAACLNDWEKIADAVKQAVSAAEYVLDQAGASYKKLGLTYVDSILSKWKEVSATKEKHKEEEQSLAA